MKTLGNDIYIQRGETWSLDFAVVNDKGDPYMLFREWKNPYLAITVTAARYEQKGDFRRTWWLDMDNRWVEQSNGTFEMIPMKRFTETDALYTMYHIIDQVMVEYGQGWTTGGRITADGNKNSPFDVTNFLFFTDPNADNKRIYKYCKDYTIDTFGTITSQIWEEYDFRIIKQFNTKDWMEQNYLFDIKVLAGENIQEHIYNLLIQDEKEDIPDLPWTDKITLEQIRHIDNKKKQKEILELFNNGQPLMPDYDTKSLILQPTKITVSANIQGGIR